MKVELLIGAKCRKSGLRACWSRLFVNWIVKPFSMALFAWAFFRFVFAHFITSAEADQYIAGCIILRAQICDSGDYA